MKKRIFNSLSKLMKSGNFVNTNTYFSSFYFFTALHGIHLLGGLFFWGKVSSRIFKLEEKDYINEEKNINALSLYWLFLFIVWIVFFTIMFVYNDTVIAWCKSLISQINYKNKTKIVPTAAIITKSIFTDFKYFFVSGLSLSFENTPAPKDMTIKKIKTKTSIEIKIPSLLNIILLIIVVYLR